MRYGRTAEPGRCRIRWRRSSPCWAPCSLTAAASADVDRHSCSPEDFYLQAEPGDLRDHLRDVQLSPRSSTRSRCSTRCSERGVYDEESLHAISHAAHGDHADGRQRQAVCAASSMTRRCCAVCPQAASEHRRDGLRGRRLGAGDSGSCGKADLRPARAAISERALEHIGNGAAQGLRPPDGAGPVRQRHSGPVHRPARPGQEDQRPQQVRPHPDCRPARHGQDVHGAEHCAERGEKEPAARPWRFSPWKCPGSSWSCA